MILCVDTGGTKTLVAEFGNNGHPYRIHRFATPHNTDTYIKKLSTLITQEYNLLEVEAISIGVPGEIEHGRVVWCKNLPWKNFDLVRELGAALHYVRPIHIDNDANMAAIGEAHALHPVPHSLFYLTVSTGIGGCLVVDGVIEPGLGESEVGMMVVEYNGNVIQWENLASGRALHESTGQFARDITDPVIWHDVASKLSRGLLDLIPMLQPDVIVIGGSIGTYFDRFAGDLFKLIDHDLYAHIKRPRLLRAAHPEEAVIYGCYAYAHQASAVK